MRGHDKLTKIGQNFTLLVGHNFSFDSVTLFNKSYIFRKLWQAELPSLKKGPFALITITGLLQESVYGYKLKI